MKITIGECEIPLNKKEVDIAKAAVDSFLSAFQEHTEGSGVSQYLTVIIYMYIKSSKLLDGIGINNAESLMKIFNHKNDE